MPHKADDLRRAVGGLDQIDGHFGMNVAAAMHPVPRAEKLAEKALAENIAEGLENVADVAEMRGRRLPGPARP